MRALILTGNGVEECELMYARWRLQEEEIQVDVAAQEVGLLEGRHNCYTLHANVSFFKLWGADYYDLLILPGGTGQESVRLDPKALETTRQMVEDGKVVGAIGHGIETLVSAGVMEGHTATCAPGVRDELKLAGATYVDEPVVVDGNIITSRGADDLPHFMRAVLNAAKG